MTIWIARRKTGSYAVKIPGITAHSSFRTAAAASARDSAMSTIGSITTISALAIPLPVGPGMPARDARDGTDKQCQQIGGRRDRPEVGEPPDERTAAALASNKVRDRLSRAPYRHEQYREPDNPKDDPDEIDRRCFCSSCAEQ